jgi:hypothetical protein
VGRQDRLREKALLHVIYTRTRRPLRIEAERILAGVADVDGWMCLPVGETPDKYSNGRQRIVIPAIAAGIQDRFYFLVLFP